MEPRKGFYNRLHILTPRDASCKIFRVLTDFYGLHLKGATLGIKGELNPVHTGGVFKVCREIDFCYGHRLLNYEGKCRYPHGHNGRVEIEIVAKSLDHRGMVVDFNDIKSVIKTWIDKELDHRMLLHREDPLVQPLKDLGEPLFLLEENPTAENIAKLIFLYAVSQGFQVTRVRLWETFHSYAEYEGSDETP